MKAIKDLEKAAQQGSILAISRLTGVTRQTLYRWKKQGRNLHKELARHRMEKRGPGRPITYSPDLPGMNPRKLQTAARKALTIATREWITALENWKDENPAAPLIWAQKMAQETRTLDKMMPIILSRFDPVAIQAWMVKAKIMRRRPRVYADLDHPFDRPQRPWNL